MQQPNFIRKKHLLFFLLLPLALLFSCQNENTGSVSKNNLPVEAKKNPDISYDSLLEAFKSLRQDPLLKNASVGYLIVDVTSPDPVIVAEYHAKRPLIPASTLKIFVTGAALEFFGSKIISEVTITNQMSVNWRSSKLLRRIGGKVYHESTTAAGARAIKEFWTAKGVETEGMNFDDGNGLSRNNAISPKQLVDALYAMRTSPFFKTFYESLPLAGMTGTLRRAMKGSVAVGRIRAKTGTIASVKSFAGYVHTVTGRNLIFSLIVNDYDGRVTVVKKKLEGALISMAAI